MNWEAGYFFNPDVLTEPEIGSIRSYSQKIGYRCISVAEYIEQVFFQIGYNLQATIVGFNLPFDISRLAIGHGPARGRDHEGGIFVPTILKSSLAEHPSQAPINQSFPY